MDYTDRAFHTLPLKLALHRIILFNIAHGETPELSVRKEKAIFVTKNPNYFV